jgi:hypothetical protein
MSKNSVAKPVKMMNCERCNAEIVRQMCTQRYCYICNGDANREQGRLRKRVLRTKDVE